MRSWNFSGDVIELKKLLKYKAAGGFACGLLIGLDFLAYGTLTETWLDQLPVLL